MMSLLGGSTGNPVQSEDSYKEVLGGKKRIFVDPYEWVWNKCKINLMWH